MNKLILAGAALAVAVMGLTGAANAADMPVKAPVYAPAFTWTGIYLGVNAGYGNSKSDGSEFCSTPAGVVSGAGCWNPSAAAVSSSGAFVGGQLGANYQTGMFVWGVEADIQVAHINGSSTISDPCCIPAFTSAIGTMTRSQDMDWFGTVRGRLGLAIWDRTLVYGTGGVMYGEEVVATSQAFPLVGYQAASSATHTGWVAGGGVEYALTNSLSAKLEGLVYDMGSETIAFKSPVTNFSETSSYAYKGALVRLGANLKFGP